MTNRNTARRHARQRRRAGARHETERALTPREERLVRIIGTALGIGFTLLVVGIVVAAIGYVVARVVL